MFLALARAVAVAALPVVSWLPGVFTPGKLISALPSKETPPMVRAVVKVAALPVILPLILLENVETPLTSRVPPILTFLVTFNPTPVFFVNLSSPAIELAELPFTLSILFRFVSPATNKSPAIEPEPSIITSPLEIISLQLKSPLPLMVNVILFVTVLLTSKTV